MGTSNAYFPSEPDVRSVLPPCRPGSSQLNPAAALAQEFYLAAVAAGSALVVCYLLAAYPEFACSAVGPSLFHLPFGAILMAFSIARNAVKSCLRCCLSVIRLNE